MVAVVSVAALVAVVVVPVVAVVTGVGLAFVRLYVQQVCRCSV